MYRLSTNAFSILFSLLCYWNVYTLGLSLMDYTIWTTLQKDLCVNNPLVVLRLHYIVQCFLRFWACEGRYSNAIELLTSTGVADKNDDSAFQKAAWMSPNFWSSLHFCSRVSFFDCWWITVLMRLKGFPWGTSPGVSGLCTQHILDAHTLQLLRTDFMFSLGSWTSCYLAKYLLC